MDVNYHTNAVIRIHWIDGPVSRRTWKMSATHWWNEFRSSQHLAIFFYCSLIVSFAKIWLSHLPRCNIKVHERNFSESWITRTHKKWHLMTNASTHKNDFHGFLNLSLEFSSFSFNEIFMASLRDNHLKSDSFHAWVHTFAAYEHLSGVHSFLE